MGQLYIPGMKDIDGPWLIDSKDLEELHVIFEYITEKIDESVDRHIRERADELLKDKYYKTIEEAIEKAKHYERSTKKKVTLISFDEKLLFDETIVGLLKDPKLVGFKPKEIQLSIYHSHDIEFNLKITNRFDGHLNYNVNCKYYDIEEDIKYKIEQWIENKEPNKPLQWWNKYSFLILLFSFVIAFISAQFVQVKQKVNVKDQYRTEIKQMLDVGVTDSSQTRAIELLLKYVSDYKAEDQSIITRTNKTAGRIFIISSFLFLISIIKPKTTIGIGANKRLVKIYRLYSKFILVTIPGIFIIPYLIDWIKSFW